MYFYSITVFNRHSRTKCVNFHVAMNFENHAHTFNDLYTIFDRRNYYFIIKKLSKRKRS